MNFLRDIIDDAEERWGDQEENVGRRVPFGIPHLDASLMGIPIDTGAIFGIQGEAGTRKTTFVLNLIINQCLSGRLPPGYHICIDTLESGMTIERYADIIIAMVATKILVYRHWNQTEEDNILKLLAMGLPHDDTREIVERCGYNKDGKMHRETVIRPEFFKYARWTKRQLDAVNLSKAIVRNWPVMIFGISEHPDPEIAKKRSTDTTNIVLAVKRWHTLTEKWHMKQIVIDHLQEYHFPDHPNDYELQRRVVDTIKKWQKPIRGVAWIISQIGVTSARESRQQGIDAYAQGGKVLEAEAQYMGQTKYSKDSPYYIELMRPIKSRIGMHPTLAIPIEPNSGAFIGNALEMRTVKLGGL
jgi:hypothetical protein